MMAQHTKGWNANQAPVAPSTPSQARGATDQDSDISRVSEVVERGALTRQAMDLNVKEGVVIVESRTTSSERERTASADKQTSDESGGPRRLRVADAALSGNSALPTPRSSADDTPRQGGNHAGGWQMSVE